MFWCNSLGFLNLRFGHRAIFHDIANEWRDWRDDEGVDDWGDVWCN